VHGPGPHLVDVHDTGSFVEAVMQSQTWVMSFVYIGTFGSFIGYGFAFGLVLHNQFGRTPLQPRPSRSSAAAGLAPPPGRREAGRPDRRRHGDALELRRDSGGHAGHHRGLGDQDAGPVHHRVRDPVRAHRNRQRLDLHDDPRDLPGPGEARDRRGRGRDDGAGPGPADLGRGDRHRRCRRALGGLLINLAFRQSFLVAKSGVPAFWSFLAFHVRCLVVTHAVYLRPVRAEAETSRPRKALVGV
jgi:NNP family nitrate/nitrite transporter-like MFS transporter